MLALKRLCLKQLRACETVTTKYGMSSAQEGKPMLKRTNALILFTAVESILYIAFLLLDLFNAETSLLKYLSICVCFFLCLINEDI